MKILRFSMGDLKTNTYFVINADSEAIVFDVEMDGKGIYEIAKEKGIIPKKLVLTHGHFDHSQGAKEFCELSGAKLYVCEYDKEMLSNPNLNAANFHYHGDTFGYPVTTPDETFVDGDEISLGEIKFKVLHTPGHTKGSCCFDDGENLFSGDTMFCSGFGRTDLYGGDFYEMKDSLTRLCTLSGERKVFPGHGNSTMLSRERIHLKLGL